MNALDPDEIRPEFPALSSSERAEAIFFDNPGGTQVHEAVLGAMVRYLKESNSNIGGVFTTSQETEAGIAESRSAVADFVGGSPEEIVFGNNMTTLTFHLSRSLKPEFGPEDQILVTALDHDANVAPWLYLARDSGAEVRMVKVDRETFQLDMADFESKLSSRTKLVAVGLASNLTGGINDIATISNWARSCGALLFLDAVQFAPHGLTDVQALHCDFLACSAYKYFGPHTGQLWGRREHLEKFIPYKVRPASESIPDRWETGTQNHEGIVGTGAAIDYLASLGVRYGKAEKALGRREQLRTAFNVIRTHEKHLHDRLVSGLRAIPGVQLFGAQEPSWEYRVPTVSLRKNGVPVRQLARDLAEHDIYCWDGNFYALEFCQAFGIEQSGGVLRLGLAHYNSMAEVERVLDLIDAA